jgi:hypothetical protein
MRMYQEDGVDVWWYTGRNTTMRKHLTSSGDFVIKLDMESRGAEFDDIQPYRME